MADRTSSSIAVSAGKADIMAVIADFERYPEWAEGVNAAEIVATGPKGRPERVRFELDTGVFKDAYELGYEWGGDDEVSWRLVEPGSMLSAMHGAYRLAEKAQGTTEVTYELAVDVKIPMIGMFKRKAEKKIIETALKGLKERVETGEWT